jgi:putative membrane protein
MVYAIKIRRFLTLFLATLPFAILDKAGVATPLIVALVAYSLLALDQIGVELENPFRLSNLSHLPLDQICQTIEQNVMDAAKVSRERPTLEMLPLISGASSETG